MEKCLVTNGEEFDLTTLATANFDGDRVPLPARLAKSLQLKGDAAIDCFLLVMAAGRYRVVLKPSSGPKGSSTLAKILRRWEELGAPGDVLDVADNEQAGMRARLIPTLISPMGTGWRITIPKEAKMLVRTDADSPFVFVLLVAGYVELWFPDTLRQFLSVPITKALK